MENLEVRYKKHQERKKVYYLVYLYYPALIALMVWGARVSRKGEWNEDSFGLSQFKSIQGYFAVCIMFHHMAQKSCAYWHNPSVIVHGLDFFIEIGFIFVGFFFFCSGFGLVKSKIKKPDYMKGYFRRRFVPVLLVFLVTTLIFRVVRIVSDTNDTGIFNPWAIGGCALTNPNAWYVITQLLIYVLFFLCFRWCKNVKVSIVLMSLCVIGWTLHLDWFMFGTWWYNSIYVFIMGMLFAEHEEAITGFLRKGFVFLLPLVTVLMFVVFGASEILRFNGQWFGKMPEWFFRWVILILQNLSSALFVLFFLLLSMKIRFGNKVLSFFGTLTLEFYLIHGLFVELFGYSFISDQRDPIFYIRNPFFYVIAVTVLSVPAAWLLKKLDSGILKLAEKNKAFLKNVFVGRWKVRLSVFAGIIVFALVCFAGISRRSSSGVKEAFAAYKAEHENYIEVNGKKMNVLVTGNDSAKDTILMLRGFENCFPTLTLYPLAERLSPKFNVIIPDFFGTGFSDDTDSPRTTENIVSELNEVLSVLGVNEPVVLLANEKSGIYASYMVRKTPEKIKALIMADGFTPEYAKRRAWGDYSRRIKKEAFRDYSLFPVLVYSGALDMYWEVVGWVFQGNSLAERDLLKEMFKRRGRTKNIIDESAAILDNSLFVAGWGDRFTYPENLPVLTILGQATVNGAVYGDIGWENLHESAVTNPEIQIIRTAVGGPELVYRVPDLMTEYIMDFKY